MDLWGHFGDMGLDMVVLGLGSGGVRGPISGSGGSDLVGRVRRSHPLYYTPRARGSVLDKLRAEMARSIRTLIGCFRPQNEVMCAETRPRTFRTPIKHPKLAN